MSVVKVIEIVAEANETWEAAAQKAVTEATQKVENIDRIFIEIRAN